MIDPMLIGRVEIKTTVLLGPAVAGKAAPCMHIHTM